MAASCSLTMDGLRRAADLMKACPPAFRIITSIHLVDHRQVRFPRSKKRRIRKKWSNRGSNWRSVPSAQIYELHTGILLMHPVMADRFVRQLVARED